MHSSFFEMGNCSRGQRDCAGILSFQVIEQLLWQWYTNKNRKAILAERMRGHSLFSQYFHITFTKCSRILHIISQNVDNLLA